MSWAPAEVLAEEEDFTPPEVLVAAEEDFIPPEAIPTSDRTTGSLLLTPSPAPKVDMLSPGGPPDPALPPPVLDMGAEQAASLARDAIADTNARRGIFSPDSPPFRLIDDQFAIDPLRYDSAAAELWKDGLIDSDQYFRMMNEAEDIKALATARRDLERQAGDYPELKSALYGFGKGALQTGAAIGVGATTGTALAPTGPGAIVGGIAAGVGASLLVGDMYDTFAAKIGEQDETMASLLAARQLAPGYDTAGQLASILIPAPAAISKLKTATSLIATERGTAEAAKFAARVTGTGAGIGAATDLAIQGGMAGIDLASGTPPTFAPESLGISTALGALTAGLGVKSNNRVYLAEELPILEQRVKLGTATREATADYWTMRRTIEILREDQRLLEAGAIARSTVDFMGNRVLDTNTVINPRFQRDLLTEAGFEPRFSSTTQPPAPRPALPYAAEPTAAPVTGTPPSYTGQTFIDRGGPAPAFQGGTTALPGPEGIQALPGPLPEAPVATVKESLPVPTPAPLPEPPPTQAVIEGVEPVWFPVDQIKLSKDVPNFKEGADTQTGVVKGEQLQGKVNRIGLAPIQVWRRLNGDVEVISGRHRLDLHRRTGEKQIQVQIFNEADGFTKQDALTLDAELNIQDEKGTIKDYAAYFRNTNITEQQATERGLLSRQKGISGFAIGRGGSDDLYAAFAAGKLPESKAAAIALAAPGDADTQRIGLQYAPQLSAPELSSFIAVSRRAKQPGVKQGDLFGNSDDNLNAAVALVKASRSRITEIDNQILSVKGAVKRPEAARKMGVDINDPESIRLRMSELEDLKEKYTRFYEHPAILREIRALAFGEEQMPLVPESEMPFNLTGEPLPATTAAPPVDEEAATRAAVRKAGEEGTMPLFDAGPQSAPKAKSPGSKSKADLGPLPRAISSGGNPISQAQAIFNQQFLLSGVVHPSLKSNYATDFPNSAAYYAEQPQAIGAPEPGQTNAGVVRVYARQGAKPATPNEFILPKDAQPIAEFTPAQIRAGEHITWFNQRQSSPPAPKPAPVKPALATYSDAQVYADFPDALGVVRSKSGQWTMPLILGGTLTPEKIPAIEMPELLEFYRSLVGQDPKIRKLPSSLGLFDPASGSITLRPDIAANEGGAMMVFAHEVGHAFGWMDDREIRLGNLGGHIMNVRNFLKSTFPLEPGGKIITAKERKDLYKQARNSMPKGSKPERDDPGLGDWQAEIASRYRELIQDLMTERGLVYVGPRRGDFEAGAYDPNIREELIALSEWWKPIDYDIAPESYLQYRHSAVELYADAFSVLLNSPADLQQRAPVFWEAFFNYLDKRPQAAASLLEIQNRVLNGQAAVLDKRLERDLAAFKSGRETFLRKHNAAIERRKSLTGWWDNLKDQYWNRYQPLLEAAARARAAGKITPAEEDAYRWMTEEHPLADGKLQIKLADIGRLYQFLESAGVPKDYLGIYLKFHRIANERYDVFEKVGNSYMQTGESGRSVIFNPGGETARTAADMLAKIRSELGPDKALALDEAVRRFRGIVFEVMIDANDSGMFSPDLWKLIVENRDNYAAFTPLEYVEEYLPAGIRKQIGTFKDIADPFQQTILKMVSMHRAAQSNRFKRGVVSALRETAPEVVSEAKMQFNGRAMVPVEPRDSELALLSWKDKGQIQGIYIPKRYARMMENQSPAERDAILQLLNAGFQRFVYGAIIRYNPAFQLFMSPMRDLQRSITNMPGGIQGRARFLGRLFSPSSWGAAVDWARGDVGRNALLAEMIENAAVGGPHTAFGGRMGSDDDALVAILRKFHLQDQPSRNALVRAIMSPLKAIEFAGQVLQLLPKAAAYQVLVKDSGMPAPQAANTIRNHIGIPNYYKKGRNVQSAGAIIPFANIFLRSYESLFRNLSGKERNMGGKEWWLAWLLTGGGLYAVLQTLAREGVFGEDLQRLYSRVPQWDMTNFGIIPLGETKSGDTGGKTVYLRLPQDEGLRVINGIVSKTLSSAIRTSQGDPTAPDLGDVFAGISSQVPGVNPVLEVSKNWTTFLAGRNPRDEFRNRYILSDDQWLAGGWEATQPMLAWTLGATGITNFASYDPKADNLTELTISATPVLNRFLKVSDRGIYQDEAAMDQADKKDMARARLSLPDFVQGLRVEFNYLKGRGERRSERENDRYNELKLWQSRYRFYMGQFETNMELGDRPSAKSNIESLVQDSRDFRRD